MLDRLLGHIPQLIRNQEPQLGQNIIDNQRDLGLQHHQEPFNVKHIKGLKHILDPQHLLVALVHIEVPHRPEVLKHIQDLLVHQEVLGHIQEVLHQVEVIQVVLRQGVQRPEVEGENS